MYINVNKLYKCILYSLTQLNWNERATEWRAGVDPQKNSRCMYRYFSRSCSLGAGCKPLQGNVMLQKKYSKKDSVYLFNIIHHQTLMKISNKCSNNKPRTLTTALLLIK